MARRGWIYILFLFLVLGACGANETATSSAPGALPLAESQTATPDVTGSRELGDWISFAVTEGDTFRGMMSSSGDIILLSTEASSEPELFLLVQGDFFQLGVSEWASGWLDPEEPELRQTMEIVEMIFDPLFEAGPFNGQREVNVDDQLIEFTYQIDPDAPDGAPGVTVANEFGSFYAAFDVPAGGYPLPDVANVAVNVDDFVGPTAHPIAAAWLEATQERNAPSEAQPLNPPPVTAPTTTAVQLQRLSLPETIGRVLSPNTVHLDQSEQDAYTDPESDCFALTTFNWHKTDMSGYDRVRIFEDGAHIERTGGYDSFSPEGTADGGMRLVSECPQITFEDGRTATSAAITEGLPDAWTAFQLNLNDGTDVLYAFGTRERVISVVRLELSAEADRTTDPVETLLAHAERSARRLLEAPIE